ncbi:hypothetical protein GO755_31410 [Spirosoma sp. HMF4905]|uniref:Uncharacterized protein n=1 Tax=Spirosoma arboris TaxID=2682092 RepID=A0A7K1SL91_9BACT|nr:hypothetical protein [Spirosoma arboris]MVM34579.1 hypothetical protein [Spirosoma arboris]
MKALIGIIISICLLGINGQAQVPTSTKVHFLNSMIGLNAELKTTIDPKNPIRIKPRTWAIIQPAGDSLGFIIDNKPYFLHFSPNKHYYFVIQAGHFSRPVITEKSEQEFILSAAAESAKGPEEYILSKESN